MKAVKAGIRTNEVSDSMVEQADKDLQAALKALETGTEVPAATLEKTPPAIAVSAPPATDTPPIAEEPAKPVTEQKNDHPADELASKLAAKDAEIADLQRRIREQGGQFGGTLDQLRQQLRQSDERMLAALAEIKALKDKSEKPPEAQKPPEPDEDVDPELKSTMSPEFVAREKARRAQQSERLRQLEAKAAKAEAEAEEAKRVAFEERVVRYNDTITGAVPNFADINVQGSPFIQWAQQQVIEQVDGSRVGLLDRLNAAAQSLDPRPIIAAVKKFNESQQADPSAKAAQEEAARKAKESQAQREADARSHGAPSAAAAPQAKTTSKEADEARARRERIQAYEAKLKSKQGITQKDLDQYAADTDAELQASLAPRAA